MWIYASGLVVLVVAAEALGLGGIPAHGVIVENILFAGLLLALIVTALRKSLRR
jgi:uncharacterized membrane protein YtjA (UPF0391 family)